MELFGIWEYGGMLCLVYVRVDRGVREREGGILVNEWVED